MIYHMSHVLLFQEQHHDIICLEIARSKVDLARIFRVMGEAATSLPLLDYSVCQNTLDNVRIHTYIYIYYICSYISSYVLFTYIL